MKFWGERRDSNPRQPESQSGTLPTELRPPLKIQHYSFSHKKLSKIKVLAYLLSLILKSSPISKTQTGINKKIDDSCFALYFG